MSNIIVTGYASVFGVLDDVGDIIERGAFTKHMGRVRNMPFLNGHNQGDPIGRILKAEEDWYGLFITVEIFEDIAKGKELITLINGGMRVGLSIGYRAEKSSSRLVSDTGQTERYVRSLQVVKLIEVSCVNNPANDKCMIMKKKRRKRRCG